MPAHCSSKIDSPCSIKLKSIVALLVLTFVARQHAEAQSSGAPELKIMSYNIRYGTANDGRNHWRNRKGQLTDLIRKHQPDLLGTQETLAFQAKFLQDEFSEYESLGVGRDDGRKEGEMVTLFYRKDRFKKLAGGHFWLSESPEVPGSKSWDTSLTRMTTWVRLQDTRDPQQRELLFLNAHLDHQGAQTRLESCRLIVRKIQELRKTANANAAVILTGDFNAGEGSEPYNALFADQASSPAKLLIDTFRFVHREKQPFEGTFNGFDVNRTDGARIDWIAVSNDWQIQDASIDRTATDGRTPSDHFPVLATIKR